MTPSTLFTVQFHDLLAGEVSRGGEFARQQVGNPVDEFVQTALERAVVVDGFRVITRTDNSQSMRSIPRQ
jgi:hypothetical protein